MYNTVDDLARDGGKKIGKPGKRTGIRTVDTEAELDAIWDQFATRGTRLTGSAYPGDRVAFSDGSEIGRRAASKAGGPTIDVLGANGERVKIHINPWPPAKAAGTP